MRQRSSRGDQPMRHWLWICLAVAIVAAVLTLFTRVAAAQTERGTELIERALAAEPSKDQGGRLYRELCSSCHGRKAYGSASPVTPSLAAQLPLYVIKQLVDFAEGDRTDCYGTRGEGDAEHATPALGRQHYSYLLMQMRRLAIGHRYSVPIEVIEVLEKLPFDSLTAIADYASRLPAQSPSAPEQK